jgi:hypothetical protein
MEKKWLRVGEARKLLGYQDGSSVHRLALRNNVRTQPGYRKGAFEYHRGDLLKALERIQGLSYFKHEQEKNFVKFNTFRHIREPVLVIADAHAPFMDWELFEEALRVKDKYKISRVVLAGDTLNCSAQSPFFDMFKIEWDVEKREARKFIKACAKEFDKVDLLTANHELRFMKLLWIDVPVGILQRDAGKEMDVWETALSNMGVELKDKIHISVYPFCDVFDTWRICHPSTCHKNPLSLARELNKIYGKSIVLAHAHMSAIAPAPNTKYTLIDCGIFANPKYFGYKNMRITSHYQWSESFAVILDDDWGQLFMKGSPFH